MKVLFIYPDISSTFSRTFHYGLGYLSAVLQEAGHETSLLHVTSEWPRRRLVSAVLAEDPGLVAFSATTHQFPYVRRHARWVKSAATVPTICGGIHATLSPEEVITEHALDILCRGEGEQPLLELAERLEAGGDPSDIPNLWVKRDGAVSRNPLRPTRRELDTLPFPDRRFDTRIGTSHVGDLMAGRGCPYDCSYCCNHSLKALYRGKGRYVRYRSVENVLSEIDELVCEHHVRRLDFHDDTFTLSTRWLFAFCEAYAARFDLPFVCNGRPNTLTREVLSALKAAGCEMVRIGVESGSERVRNEVLGRELSDDELRRVFRDAARVGLQTSAFNMVGIPGETRAELEATLRLNEELRPTRAVVTVFYPYPLTALHALCEAEGMLTSRQKRSHTSRGTTLDLPTLRESEINDAYDRFHNTFYRKQVALRSPRLVGLYAALEQALGGTRARRTWIRARWLGFRVEDACSRMRRLRTSAMVSYPPSRSGGRRRT